MTDCLCTTLPHPSSQLHMALLLGSNQSALPEKESAEPDFEMVCEKQDDIHSLDSKTDLITKS